MVTSSVIREGVCKLLCC